MKKQNLWKKGVSLVELMLYMGIFSIIIVILTQIFVSTFEVRRESQAVSYVAQDARFILTRLTYDIQRATAITTPAALGDIGSTLTLTIDGITNTYTITGTDLTLNGGKLNGFNTTISNLSFQRLGNSGGKHVIKLSYTVTGKVIKASGAEVRTIQTAVGIR